METKCLVEFEHQILWNFSNCRSKSLHGNGTNLLSLGLGVVLQPGQVRWKQDLKGVDASNVRGHRYDGDDPPASSFGGNVRSVVADNDGRSSFVCFTALRRLKIYDVDLASPHYYKPSDAVASQSFSSSFDQSAQALS